MTSSGGKEATTVYLATILMQSACDLARAGGHAGIGHGQAGRLCDESSAKRMRSSAGHRMPVIEYHFLVRKAGAITRCNIKRIFISKTAEPLCCQRDG